VTPAGRRRTALYATAVVLGGALLLLGFGITVPPDLGTRLSGAALLAQVGDYDSALAELDAAIRENPRSVDAFVYRGAICARAARHADALAAYDRALALGAPPALARDIAVDRASVLLALGRAEEFRAERDRLAREAEDSRIHLLDGIAAEHARDWAGAAAAYRRAADRDPSDEATRSRLYAVEIRRGEAALAEGRLVEARDAFDAARAAMPGDAGAHLRAAEVRIALDDAPGALDVLRGVRRDTPGAAALVFRAATRELDAGRGERAFWALAAAMEADPEGTASRVRAEPAWRACAEDPRLLELLSRNGTAPSARLTERG
jgi:tetratricopeptide (TPR) repeat protein